MCCSTRSIEDTAQSHAVVESGWGKLLHKCYDVLCMTEVRKCLTGGTCVHMQKLEISSLQIGFTCLLSKSPTLSLSSSDSGFLEKPVTRQKSTTITTSSFAGMVCSGLI